MEIVQSITSVKPVSEFEEKGKVEKKSGIRVGYNYIIVKSYKESKKNDVVKCLYIKSLSKFGFCVIKEGSHGDTKDKNGRDIIDRLKWQQQLHQELQDKIRIPRLLGHFEERGNYYLVIEHIKGIAFQKLCQKYRRKLRNAIIAGDKLGLKFLDYLIQMAALLDTLHSHQVVHRDATPNNYMIMPGGKVAIIDMEMCYSLLSQFPTPAFQLGTYGYMSPQQEATLVPTSAEDIFALGAIIFQLWSGVSPGKVTSDRSELLMEKIKFFIPDQQIAELVALCISPEDDRRPNAAQIRNVLEQYGSELKLGKKRSLTKAVFFSHGDIVKSIQEGINTLSSPLLADEEKGWFANDMKEPTEAEKHKLRKQWYASCNRGVSGVMYFLAQAKKAGFDINLSQACIEKGLNLIANKYILRIDKTLGGFYFGSDGVAAVMASCMRVELFENTFDHLEWIRMLLEKEKVEKNFSSGVAGQGIANLMCRPFLDATVVQNRLKNYGKLLIDAQERDGSWNNGFKIQKYTRRKIKKVSLGFSEGMAGIIYFLLELSRQEDLHSECLTTASMGLKYIMKKAKTQKGVVYWALGKDKELDYGFAHGTSGIALTFIKAYEITGIETYKKFAVNVLRGIPVNFTDNNIGQQNGLSGLGEIYLDAYRVFNDKEWFDRAGQLAQVIMQLGKVHAKHGTYWLVENERHPVANMMVGNSGVLHFLMRYCYPELIDFPLLPGKTNS